MEALERDAPDEEIERLMEELQQAMNNFLDELVKQMQEQMAEGDQQLNPQEMPNGNEMVNRQDLMEMLERARELAKSGDTDAAREMLSPLRAMLENLRSNPYAQKNHKKIQKASRSTRDLNTLTRDQQEQSERAAC